MNTIVKEIELTFEEYNKRLMDSTRYIGSDGSGNYHCTLCEHKWRAYQRYLLLAYLPKTGNQVAQIHYVAWLVCWIRGLGTESLRMDLAYRRTQDLLRFRDATTGNYPIHLQIA